MLETTGRAALKRNAVLLASLLFMIIGTGSIYFLVVALKLISAEFDWPRVVPSTAYAMQYLGGGFGGIFMGYLLDRFGMGLPGLFGAVMIGCGAILTSMVTEPWHLYVIYGLMLGFLGRAALFSPLTANITRWFEHKKSAAVGIVGSGQAISGAVWPPVFQVFFDWIGWRETAVWYGLFVLATMLPLLLILRMRPPESDEAGNAPDGAPRPARSPQRSLAGMSPLRMQLTLSIASIGCCVAMSLPLAHIVSHVSDLGYDPANGAAALSVMLSCAALGSFFGVGYLGTRFGGLKAIFIFSSAQAVFLVAFTFAHELPSIFLVAALFGLGYGGILPCYPVIIREYLPAPEVGRRTGVVVLFAGGGMALGSFLGGAVFDRTGSYNLAFLIGAAFNLANLAIIASLIVRTGRHYQPSPTG
ncbi:MAG: MFS transporter [Alphaproteobacteria bacterium]|nr:MFS transporter [Alphaproteobacteria bacterium]MCB9930354.1 MFS transporter [Alphaproteobacteria bacterium]